MERTAGGYVGAIYQAMNWIYTGPTDPADEYIVGGPPDAWPHAAIALGMHVGKPWIRRWRESSKHRYLFLLDKSIAKQIELLRQSYPKRERQSADRAFAHKF